MSALARATAAWGGPLPAWIQALAQECDRTTARATAGLIGYSPAAVSLVLGARYTGDLSAVEQAVRGRLLAATVDCPVIGELAADVCLAHQRATWSPHSPQRIQFYRACRSGCRFSRLKEGAT